MDIGMSSKFKVAFLSLLPLLVVALMLVITAETDQDSHQHKDKQCEKICNVQTENKC